MLQKEFEDRTGMSVSAQEFDTIHEMYMSTQMDKDEFCKEYKKVGKSALVVSLCDRINELENHIDKSNSREKAREQKDLEMAKFLVDIAEKYSAVELRAKAISIMGERAYLTYKIESDYKLWKIDRDLICEILNNR